jgi:hypothetical protein
MAKLSTSVSDNQIKSKMIGRGHVGVVLGGRLSVVSLRLAKGAAAGGGREREREERRESWASRPAKEGVVKTNGGAQLLLRWV